MPLKLDVRKKLCSRSDRVKAIDLHPTEPWICASLYNGNVHVWNIESQQLIKTFEVCQVPVRAVRFIARMNWIVAGADNQCLTVYNYNTLERVHQQVEAHTDYIRSIVVHPIQPLILTCSDDVSIRLWDWEKNWKCAQVFNGHSHYVMQLVLNPKDMNTFASASLDNTVKVWSLGAPTPNFTLEGHEKGVNCVDYHPAPDKPYLASGSDDRTVRIWDYQTKLCVQILEGHSQNVTALCFHTELPVILTGSEDDTVRVWHAATYRLESTLNYGLGRVWCLGASRGSSLVGADSVSGGGGRQTTVGVGCDEGTIVLALGREHPAVSMDASGKLVCARHMDLLAVNLRSVIASVVSSAAAGGGDEKDASTMIEDGARLPVVYKEMGASEVFPHTVSHNANGRFVAVCGDGEYVVYTAVALRNRTFGSAIEFVWSHTDPTAYAILESNSTLKIFKNFKEAQTLKLDFGADALFGGHLLGVRASGAGGLSLYDWVSGVLIRRIDVSPLALHWAEDGRHLAVCTKDTLFILRHHPEAAAEALAQGINDPDGVEAAFELLPEGGELKESVRTGCWFGEAFLFTNATNRLQYYVGGELVSVAHLDQPMYLLGYLASENRVFLINRDLKVVSYALSVSVLEYESAVLRGDFEAADAIIPRVPVAARTKVAHFLDRQGFKAQALRVSTDPEHKFSLAIDLADLKTAHELIRNEEVEGNEPKWKQLAEVALKACDLGLAQECFAKTHDFASFLLVASSCGDAQMMRRLAVETSAAGAHNLAFLSAFLLGDLDACLEILEKSERHTEAALFARTYLPSRVSAAVEKWRTALRPTQPKAAEALADPEHYPNLFPHWPTCLANERWLAAERKSRQDLHASAYVRQTPLWQRDVTAEAAAPPPSADLLGLTIEEAPQTEAPAVPIVFEAPEEKRDPIGDLLNLSKVVPLQEPAVKDEEEEEEEEEEAFHEAPPVPATEEDPFCLVDLKSPTAPPPSSVAAGGEMDDFDAELEQQLAAFNIGAPAVAHRAQQRPVEGDEDDDGWGDDDDDEEEEE